MRIINLKILKFKIIMKLKTTASIIWKTDLWHNHKVNMLKLRIFKRNPQ